LVELSTLSGQLRGVEAFATTRLLVQWRGQSWGWLTFANGYTPISADQVWRAAAAEYGTALMQGQVVGNPTPMSWQVMQQALKTRLLERAQLTQDNAALWQALSVTVVIATYDRPDDLRACLQALLEQDTSRTLEIIVIDNHPASKLTPPVVATFPSVRLLFEARQGSSYARNAGILASSGDIIVTIDDDVIVSPGWLEKLLRPFAQSSIAAVTGGILPFELKTEAQQLFEVFRAPASTFTYREFDLDWFNQVKGGVVPTWEIGLTANAAYRAQVFRDPQVRLMEELLGGGTPAGGGEDIYWHYRLLKAGYRIAYEPNAYVWHKHRQTLPELHRQVYQWIKGGTAYSLMVWICDRDWRGLQQLLFALPPYYANQIGRRLRREIEWPLPLILTEIKGSLAGVGGFVQSWQRLRKLGRSEQIAALGTPLAIRTLELSQPLPTLTDILGYEAVRLFLTVDGNMTATLDVVNYYQPLKPEQLQWHIERTLKSSVTDFVAWKRRQQPFAPLASTLSVAIVIATYDRPDDLKVCLQHLTQQVTERLLEIIVVDNHPASGLTPAVVAEFPQVKLYQESRQGSAYARNAGILASRGDLIITTDDDVIAPPNWLETLIAPFNDASIMAITGNILPHELATYAQRLFEAHSSLSRGYQDFRVDGAWFKTQSKAILGWEFGATANAAFRASIFHDPQIGLMKETLGPGTAAGAGEDPHLFYKILKAGHGLYYNSAAYVWHKHRQDISALSRQAYNYSKSSIAYHLTLLLQENDRRSLAPLVGDLQRYYIGRLLAALRGRLPYPVSLVLRENIGWLIGPWGFLYANLRVLIQGRSQPQSFSHRLPYQVKGQVKDQVKDQVKETAYRLIARAKELWGFQPSQVLSPPLQQAKALVKAGEFETAKHLYQQIITLEPDNVLAQENLANLLSQTGEPQQAITLYQALTQLKPNQADYYDHLGQLYLQTKQFSQAATVYTKLTQLKPQNSWYLCCLGDVLTQQGELGSAIQHYKKAVIARNPTAAKRTAPMVVTDNPAKPHFIINGFAKCGTTSLYQYLTKHPNFLEPAKKEICFFDEHYDNGLDWYLSHFSPNANREGFITGEASTRYIDYPLVYQRIHQALPAIKLIIMMRNPVDRLVSDYYMSIRLGLRKYQPFEDVVDQLIDTLKSMNYASLEDTVQKTGPGFFTSSLYLYRLKPWLNTFKRDQFLFIPSEAFFADPTPWLNQVLTFLELPDFTMTHFDKYNSAAYPPLHPDIRHRLHAFFAPHNQALEDHLGMAFNWE
jgi:O-antigen biosynthesis protein